MCGGRAAPQDVYGTTELLQTERFVVGGEDESQELIDGGIKGDPKLVGKGNLDVSRLVDLGVEPYLLAGTLRGVISQRLVRTLCPKCKKGAPVSGLSAKTRQALKSNKMTAPKKIYISTIN